MNILKLVQGLLPSFERRRVLEDLHFKADELKETVLPCYKAAAEALGNHTFEDPELKKWAGKFGNDHRSGIKGNHLTVVAETAKRLNDNMSVIEKAVNAVFADDIVAAGLTFRKASLLQFVGYISFFLTYARRLLLWTYIAETAKLDLKSGVLSKELSKGEMDWLLENADSFAKVVRMFSVKANDFEKALANIPDMIIRPDNLDNVSRTIGDDKLDPFRANLIPARLNPIFAIRMRVAEWQVARYEAAKQERRVLEFRLLNLQQQAKGKDDPKVQQAIAYNEARLSRLNYRLKEMEEEYA